MSPQEHASDHECAADAAAYVLGALEPHEAIAFRRHLDTCVICRDELAAYGAVVSVLPLAAPPQPLPRAVKRRMMGEIKAEQRSAARRAVDRPARQPRFLLTRPLAGALGGAVAVLAAIAIVLGGSGSGSSVRLVHATTTWSATGGNATLKLTRGHAELIVNRAPAPPAGQVYEVWLRRGAQPPASTNVLFGVTGSGAGNVDVPGNLHGVRQVMVTVEPAGGSREPTHPPVVVANLT